MTDAEIEKLRRAIACSGQVYFAQNGKYALCLEIVGDRVRLVGNSFVLLKEVDPACFVKMVKVVA